MKTTFNFKLFKKVCVSYTDLLTKAQGRSGAVIQFMSAFVIVFIVSGCAGASPKQPEPAESAIVCKAPRRTMCTKAYRPVCGHFADGTLKTFSNPCTACSNKDVVSFTHGACSK